MYSSVEGEKEEEVRGDPHDSDKDDENHSSDQGGGGGPPEEEPMEVSNEPSRPQRRMLDSGSDSDV